MPLLWHIYSTAWHFGSAHAYLLEVFTLHHDLIWSPIYMYTVSARPPEVTLRCHLFTTTKQNGTSQLWAPLFGIAYPLTSVLCCETCLALFINCSRFCYLAGPWSGSPLNSSVEEALCKFYSKIDVGSARKLLVAYHKMVV